MADVAIVAFIALGAIAGFSKGFVMPLLAAGGAVLTLGALYSGPLNGALPSGNFGLGAGALALVAGGAIFGKVGGVLVGLLQRFPFLRRVDRVLGVPVGVATAAVTVYVTLLGALTLDAWLDPLHGKSAIGPQEIAAVQAAASANPTFAVFADPTMLKTLAQAAASTPVAKDKLAQFDAALAFYEETIRPALLESTVAPVFLSVGEKLPVVGRPAKLPTR